jgi:hypothetical protein
MTDIIVKSKTWTPPGGIVRLDQPGQRLRAAAGLGQVTVLGGVFATREADAAQVESSIRLDPPAAFGSASAVEVCASRVGVHCEVNLRGRPIHGVSILAYPNAGEVPEDVNLDGLYVYDNIPAGVPTHGVYFSDSIAATGKNMRFVDIRGGWALHFYPNCQDSVIESVSTRRCQGDVIFWEPAVTGNRVSKLLSQDVGPRGVVAWGEGASEISNTVDFVTVPPGYGCQG